MFVVEYGGIKVAKVVQLVIFVVNYFFCSEVRKRCMVIEYKDLNILRVLTWKERLLIKSNYFSSREDILNDLYTGSLVVGSIRKCYRIIKTFMGRKGTN